MIETFQPDAVDSAEEKLCYWYALRTYPRHEKSVREHLLARNVVCFLPLYRKNSRWKNGCNVRVELPLFPGYIFVEIDPQRRARVLEIPGAISLVGSSHELWPIPGDQIRMLRENLMSRVWEPHEYLVAGNKVRIKSGPLTNLTGILVRKNSGLRVVLVLDQIQRGVAVEVDAGELELVAQDANKILVT
jgi:transcription antitermination factor NusG